NVVGSITQTTDNVITAAGLQLLGSGGTVRLEDASNDVRTIAASYNGMIGYSLRTAGTDDVALGTGNLTLNVVGSITQTTDNVITAAGLQLLGSGGTVRLDEANNDVTTIAASYNGTLSYTDKTALTVGTVGDTAMAGGGPTTSGIASTNHDVKLTVLAGGLVIGDSLGTAGTDDITLGTGNLTLNVVGSVTQTTDNVITAAGLQLLGSGGTVRLDEANNDVTTIGASYSGTLSYTDKTALTVGTVGDTAMAGGGPTTSGIASTNHDFKLTVLAGGLVIGDSLGTAGTDDITL